MPLNSLIAPSKLERMCEEVYAATECSVCLSIALISVDDSSCLLVFTYGFHAVNFLLPSHHSARRALEAASVFWLLHSIFLSSVR